MSIQSITPSLISPNVNLATSGQTLKLGIMASGNGSNFEAVSQAIRNQQLNAQIQVLIYNNPGAYVATRAEKYSVPKVLINHRNYKNREDFDAEIAQQLRQWDVDWVIMAGWMRLVTPVLIEAFSNQIINIHPSLLPSFKGIKAVEQALNSGVTITGCTVHLVALEMDSGPILMQAAVPIISGDTLETLHGRIQIEEHRILPQAIALAASLGSNK